MRAVLRWELSIRGLMRKCAVLVRAPKFWLISQSALAAPVNIPVPQLSDEQQAAAIAKLDSSLSAISEEGPP